MSELSDHPLTVAIYCYFVLSSVNKYILIVISLAVVLLNFLQYLFRCDHILYTIVAVSGKQSLEKSFHENSEGVSTSSSVIYVYIYIYIHVYYQQGNITSVYSKVLVVKIYYCVFSQLYE